jgi:dolichol kinase
MRLNPLSRSGCRWLLLVFVASCWMSMGVLSECDPAIAGPVITGVGDAAASVASTVITAVFQAMVPEEHTPVTTTGT